MVFVIVDIRVCALMLGVVQDLCAFVAHCNRNVLVLFDFLWLQCN